ncbi:MAG: hypothetical protein RR664_06385 [Clostridia bacterium]
MGKYTRIPANTFASLQTNAGVLLNKFDITGAKPPVEADFISATKGGIEASCKMTLKDLGEEIDNAPKNCKELQIIENWECKLSATLVGATKENIALMLGAGTVNTTPTSKGEVTPRTALQITDFIDLWWVGDRSDGGTYAINLKNALSTGGFSLKTADKGNGEFAFEATGFFSLAKQDEVPMEFFVQEPVN